MRSKLVQAIGVTVCLVVISQPLLAQSTNRIARSTRRSAAIFALAPDQEERLGRRPLPPQTITDLRSELISLTDAVQQFAELAPSDLVDSDSLQ
jgi:hypothetical protein